MNLFQQSNFPPPELSPSAKIYANDCEYLTVTFLGELSVLDERMWLTCKQLLFYDQSYSKEAQSNKELRTAIEVALSYYDLLSKMYAYLTGQKHIAIN